MNLKLHEKYATIAELQELIKKNSKTPLVWEPFIQSLLLRLSWNSNSLEGNTLSLDDTIRFIEYDEVRSGHTYKEYQEAKCVYRATKDMLSFSKICIDNAWLSKANGLVMNGDGTYRKNDVYVGTLAEAVYYPPSFEDIPALMQKFDANGICIDTLANTIQDIAKKHILFERIHPFEDGNGRTGRIIMSQQLFNCGLLPAILLDQAKYRQAFRIYHKNSSTDMMEYVIAKGIIESFCLLAEVQKNYEYQTKKPE